MTARPCPFCYYALSTGDRDFCPGCKSDLRSPMERAYAGDHKPPAPVLQALRDDQWMVKAPPKPPFWRAEWTKPVVFDEPSRWNNLPEPQGDTGGIELTGLSEFDMEKQSAVLAPEPSGVVVLHARHQFSQLGTCCGMMINTMRRIDAELHRYAYQHETPTCIHCIGRTHVSIDIALEAFDAKAVTKAIKSEAVSLGRSIINRQSRLRSK